MPPPLLDLADDLLQHGVAMVRMHGRNIRLHRADASPLGLLGVRFGPAVEAVAIRLGRDDGPVLALDRSGEAMVVTDTGPSRPADLDGSLTLDLARRSLGLPTAPPARRVDELVDAVWLDRVLRATLDAPLGEPPGWVTLARLHPANAGPASSPEALRHEAVATPTWERLRHELAEHRVRWPPVSATLARWFDVGSMARHAFAVLPDVDVVNADLADLLRPADAARIHAALSR